MSEPTAEWPDLPIDASDTEGDGEDAGVPGELLALHESLESTGVTPREFADLVRDSESETKA